MAKDPTKLAEQQERGRQAAAIKNSPLWKEAFDKADGDIIALWKETLPDHADAREQFWHLQQALLTVKEYLEHIFIKGENARKEMLTDNASMKKETT